MNVEVIVPGTAGHVEELLSNISFLEECGFNVRFDESQLQNDEPEWEYSSSSVLKRSKYLNEALKRDETEIIWAARGGYGTSDLLPLVDFEGLKDSDPKMIVGFSDVSSLHAAVMSQLNWPSLHAPMLASPLATTAAGRSSLKNTASLLLDFDWKGQLTCHAEGKEAVGYLFGGCLSVLTNLIGTPFLTPSYGNHLLFFEDIGENPGKIWRNFVHWHQAGLLEEVAGIVLGDFVDCFPKDSDRLELMSKLERMIGAPVFYCPQIGHISGNEPLMIGAQAQIKDEMLSWWFSAEE